MQSDGGSSGSTEGDAAPNQGDSATNDSGGNPSTEDSGAEGGHPEAGPKDGGAGSGCTGSTALFCEDFESGKLASGTWTSATQNGTAAVDTMQAHSGKYAYHAHVTNVGGAQAEITETMGTPQGHIFGRVYMWMEAPSPQGHTDYIFANASGQTGYSLGSMYQQFQAHAIVNGSEGHNNQYIPAAQYPQASVPTGKWACLEWEFNGTAGTATYWLNGTQWDTESGWGSNIAFANAGLGIEDYGPSPPDSASIDVWFDDFVIDTQRVGCN